MLTCTALRRRSIRPFEFGGSGRIGSIQPWAASGSETVTARSAATPQTRCNVRMATSGKGRHERRRPSQKLHSAGLSYFHGTLIGAGFERFGLGTGDVRETQVGLFDRAVGIRKASRVLGNPLEERSFVLDRRGRIGGGDHIEACRDGAVGTPFQFAGVMRRQYEQIARPRLA